MVDSIEILITEISFTSDMIVGSTVLTFLAIAIYGILKVIKVIELQDW